MVRRRSQLGNSISRPQSRRSGFTIVDLLVSIAVIALLIGIITPTLAHVRDAANKVVCASNLRQVGLGLAMYADDHDGQLPETHESQSRSDSGAAVDPQVAHTGEHAHAWSGLGWLVADGYLSTPQIFYCPAHEGEHTADAYADSWMMLDAPIRTNYAYRDALADAEARTPAAALEASMTSPHPSSNSSDTLASVSAASVLISDGFATPGDLSHETGFNLLNLGLSVTWLPDEAGQVRTAVMSGLETDEAWTILDQQTVQPDTSGPSMPTNSLLAF